MQIFGKKSLLYGVECRVESGEWWAVWKNIPQKGANVEKSATLM